MKIKLLFVIIVIFFTGFLNAQSINFRISTYVYSWQRIDSLSDNSTAKTTHLRGYQNLLFDYSQGQWSFNTLAQTEEDLIHKVDKGFNYRLYNAYIKGSGLFNNMLDLKLGRQYIFAGVGKGTVDGIYAKLKAGKNKEYQLALYGGALAPYTYDFQNYPSIKYNFSLGAQFSYYGVRDLMLGLSFVNKHEQPISYVATRLDSLFNTTTRTISFDPRSMMLAGLDARYSFKQKYDFFGKAYVDVILKKLYKGEFNASALLTKNVRVSVDYIYSQPQIALNSIFWVFEHTQNQEVSGSVNYLFNNGINAFARVGAVLYNGDHSLKIEGGIAHSMYGLTFTRYMGYAGESDGVFGYYNREIMASKFTVTSSIGYARYRIGDYTTADNGAAVEKVNSFSGVLGLNYRPMPQLSVDAQGQLMINRIYKTDARFMVGINYWLFKKL